MADYSVVFTNDTELNFTGNDITFPADLSASTALVGDEVTVYSVLLGDGNETSVSGVVSATSIDNAYTARGTYNPVHSVELYNSAGTILVFSATGESS